MAGPDGVRTGGVGTVAWDEGEVNVGMRRGGEGAGAVRASENEGSVVGGGANRAPGGGDDGDRGGGDAGGGVSPAT